MAMRPATPHCAALKPGRALQPAPIRPTRTGPAQLQVRAGAADGTAAHSTLGVQPGATKDAIKRAYRRLVLRTHPDIARDGGSQERFIQIQEAYESLIKRRGQPKSTPPVGQDSWDFWDFHDWHWRFRMQRAWAAQKHKPGEPSPYGSSERLQPLHRDQVKQQLGALRRKAAYRASKRAASPAAAAPPVECDGPPAGAHGWQPQSATHCAATGAPAAAQRAAADGDDVVATAAVDMREETGPSTAAAAGRPQRAGSLPHRPPQCDGAALDHGWTPASTAPPRAGIAPQSAAGRRQHHDLRGDSAARRSGWQPGDRRPSAAHGETADGSLDVVGAHATSDEGSAGEEDESGASGEQSEDELRWRASERVRAQLAGLRRKKRLRH